MPPFSADAAGYAAGATFTILLLAAAAEDVRGRRISNRLVVVIAGAGLAYLLFRVPVPQALQHWTLGLLVGLACWLPFYALGWLGAGDVKLFAAAGAWLGPMRAAEAAVLAAVAGGVLGMAWIAARRDTRVTAGTLKSGNDSAPDARHTLPYGIALAAGALVAAWLPGLLFG